MCHLATTGPKACIPIALAAPRDLLAAPVVSVALTGSHMALLLRDGRVATLAVTSKPELLVLASACTELAALVCAGNVAGTAKLPRLCWAHH